MHFFTQNTLKKLASKGSRNEFLQHSFVATEHLGQMASKELQTRISSARLWRQNTLKKLLPKGPKHAFLHPEHLEEIASKGSQNMHSFSTLVAPEHLE